MKFQNLPNDFHQLQGILYDSVDATLQSFLDDEPSIIRILIVHPTLDMPNQFPYMKSSEITTEMVLAKIAKVAQSKKEFKLSEAMNIHVAKVKLPAGQGSKRLTKFIIEKKSIIKINNNDNLCAFRCIVVGMALADKTNHNSSYYKQIRSDKPSLQTHMAKVLANKINFQEQTCTLEHIKAVERIIENYQILIVDETTFEFVYAGAEKTKRIIMLLHDNHYDLITSLPAFFGKRKFCFKCLKAYNNFDNHPCNEVCIKCKN